MPVPGGRHRQITIDLPVVGHTAKPITRDLDVDATSLQLVLSVRPVRLPGDGITTFVPPGTRSVAVLLVNNRRLAQEGQKDESYYSFQAALALDLEEPFVARPDIRGHDCEDWDERVADVQYRDTFEYAVGHGVATSALMSQDGACCSVTTTWLPQVEVEKGSSSRAEYRNPSPG